MRRTISVLAGVLALTASASAQDEQTVEFAGATFSITETDDYEKILTADGEEIARAYVILHDRNVKLGDIEVAIFQTGPGGNMCGTVSLMVWRDGDELKTAASPDDCGAPPPAVTQDAIFFVPYLMPGADGVVRRWTTYEGMQAIARIEYAPEPGTGWADFDPAAVNYPTDVFRNAEIYEFAQELLGEQLQQVTTGLLVSGGLGPLDDTGIYVANGCVPHACGASDSFMAVDPTGRKLYFAQQGVDETWPPQADWPDEIVAAKNEAIGDE
ncbi:hypothetical protein GTW25_09000 [Aliihoeflea aestuarii]|uniref:hypothetical protein n=1 Tax=Aliihoeflea aestuarii TaxID=453840 RepID=UPI00209278C3|nr:hypothetical protein [Aliihoeflea aestuarii]MCO6391163.1 hypothetical protein [Aliihoeflea aestuarii]